MMLVCTEYVMHPITADVATSGTSAAAAAVTVGQICRECGASLRMDGLGIPHAILVS